VTVALVAVGAVISYLIVRGAPAAAPAGPAPAPAAADPARPQFAEYARR